MFQKSKSYQCLTYVLIYICCCLTWTYFRSPHQPRVLVVVIFTDVLIVRTPHAGCGVVRIDLRFLAGCRTRRLNQVLSALYLNMFFIVLLFIRAPFMFCFCWYLFCLLVVLVELSVLTKWLARKTPLRKLNRGQGSSPESPCRRVFMIFLVYCIVSSFMMYLCCLLPLCDMLSYCYGAI